MVMANFSTLPGKCTGVNLERISLMEKEKFLIRIKE